MRLTGLSEFLWFLLLFGAMFAFTVWRQQRDRRRRQERMARMSPPAQPPPVRVEEAAPDISWGRGPALPVPPPEVARDWSEAPPPTPPPAQPPRLPTRVPLAAAPAVRRAVPVVVVRRRQRLDLRSAAGVQQAMIALTVLGPCRAMEPYGAREAQQEADAGRPVAR